MCNRHMYYAVLIMSLQCTTEAECMHCVPQLLGLMTCIPAILSDMASGFFAEHAGISSITHMLPPSTSTSCMQGNRLTCHNTGHKT